MAETEKFVEDLQSQSLEEDVIIDQGQDDLETVIKQRVASATLELKKQISGLDRKNSQLDIELRGKRNEKQTVEERLHELEGERAKERLIHAELEAFTDQKIDAEWLAPFHTDDPFERASALKNLLDQHERKVTENMSQRLGSRYPITSRKVPDKENFTTEELRGLAPAEINRLWEQGKISGSR